LVFSVVLDYLVLVLAGRVDAGADVDSAAPEPSDSGVIDPIFPLNPVPEVVFPFTRSVSSGANGFGLPVS
jgi:hypothetical protein